MFYFKGKELEGRPSEEESSSDEEQMWRMAGNKRDKETMKGQDKESQQSKPKFYELKSGESFKPTSSIQSRDLEKAKRLVFATFG